MRSAPTLLLLPLLAFLSLCACARSLHPLYTERDLVFDPALAGTWTTEDGAEFLVTGKENEKSYLVEAKVEGTHATFEAHLLRLGSQRFVDLTPLDSELGSECKKKKEEGEDDCPFSSAYLRAHLVPAHTIYRLTGEGDRLRITGLADEWVKQEARNGKLRIDRKSTRLNSSHIQKSRMPSSA